MDPYRHADPGPLPDGHVVPQPPRVPPPPVLTRRQWAYGIACAVIVVAAIVIGVYRR